MSSSHPRPSGGVSGRSSVRASTGLSTTSATVDRDAGRMSSSALADHVPNIQLGGPKGRGSTGGSRSNGTGASSPREVTMNSPRTQPATMVATQRAAKASPQDETCLRRPSLSSSFHSIPMSPRSGRTHSTCSGMAAAAVAPTSATTGVMVPPPQPFAASDVSPRSVAALQTVLTTRAGGSGQRAPSRATTPSSTTTVTARPRRDNAVAKTSETISPRPRACRLSTTKEEAAQGEMVIGTRDASAHSQCQSSMHQDPSVVPSQNRSEATPRSSRKETEDDGQEKENARPSRAETNSRPAATVTTATATPSTTQEAPRTARAKPLASISSAAAPTSPRGSVIHASVGMPLISPRGGQSRRAPREAATSEFFRHQYHYYPDANPHARTYKEQVEGDEVEVELLGSTNSSLPGSHPIHSPSNDICELDSKLRTPPNAPLFGPAGEAPFTPRGMAVSPYMQRLVEVTASAHRRGGSVASSSASHHSHTSRLSSSSPPPPLASAAPTSMYSPRRTSTMGASARAHAFPTNAASSASVSTTDSPLTSALPLARRTVLTPHSMALAREQEHAKAPPLTTTTGNGPTAAPHGERKAEAVEPESEGEAAERVALEKQVAEKKAQLARVEGLLARARAVADARRAEKTALMEEHEQVTQQVESLNARAADAKATVRGMAAKSSANDELTVLRDMLAEREQRLEALEGKRTTLARLWEQLCCLHEEACAQEQQRQAQRRERRQQIHRKQQQLMAADDEWDDEGPGPLSESERQIKRSMMRVSRAKMVAFDDSPLGIPRPTEGEEDLHEGDDCGDNGRTNETVCSDVHLGDGEGEGEPDAVPPVSSMDTNITLARQPRHMSVSPSLSCARGPSVISASTADILQNFLQELLAEMESLAMICIQRPSPPTASRANRGGVSAWVRDINTGNNGFYSFFGGATEAHLSAKPLSTFLSCASRLARSAWRAESALQLRARELATAEEDATLRRCLEESRSRGGLTRPTTGTTQADGDDDEEGSEMDDSDDCELAGSGSDTDATVSLLDESVPATPNRSYPSQLSSSPVLLTSPELSRSAGRRRHDPSGKPKSHAAPSSVTATPAPMLLLPSLAYATPLLPAVSRELDTEQRHLQAAYERDVEQERARRRHLVRTLKETYRTTVVPSLTARQQAAKERQVELARELVALGVAEVCLQWAEVDDIEEAEVRKFGTVMYESVSDEDEEDARTFRRRSRSLSVTRKDPCYQKHQHNHQSVKYLRQVIVRTLQATASPSVDGTRGSMGFNASRSSSNSIAGGADIAPGPYSARGSSASLAMPLDTVVDMSVPMVSVTRHRLPIAEAASGRHRSHGDGNNRGRGDSTTPPAPHARTDTTVGSARGQTHNVHHRLLDATSPVTMATLSPLKTVTPVAASSPLKRRPGATATAATPSPTSAREHSDRHKGGSSQARRTTTTPTGAHCSLTQETQERVGASRNGVGGRSCGPPAETVNLLGVHPADSQEVLDSGAVKVSLLFFGEEGRRRQRQEAEQDRQLRDFWALREELARVDEENFVLQCRLQEAEEAYQARHGKRAVSAQEAMDKLSHAKRYYEDLRNEYKEWKDLYRELRAVQRSMEQ